MPKSGRICPDGSLVERSLNQGSLYIATCSILPKPVDKNLPSFETLSNWKLKIGGRKATFSFGMQFLQRCYCWRKKSCAATAQLLSRLMVTCWMAKLFRCVEASALRLEGKQRHNVKHTLSRTVGLLTLQSIERLHSTSYHGDVLFCRWQRRCRTELDGVVLYCMHSMVSEFAFQTFRKMRAGRISNLQGQAEHDL